MFMCLDSWRVALLWLVADLEGVNELLFMEAYCMRQHFVNESKVYLESVIYFYQAIHKRFQVGSEKTQELLSLLHIHCLGEQLIITSQQLFIGGWTNLVRPSSMALRLFAALSELLIDLFPLLIRQPFCVNHLIMDFAFNDNKELEF